MNELDLNLEIFEIFEKYDPESKEVEGYYARKKQNILVQQISEIINRGEMKEISELKKFLSELSSYRKGILISLTLNAAITNENKKFILSVIC